MRRIETEQNDKPYVLIDAQAILGFLGQAGIVCICACISYYPRGIFHDCSDHASRC